MSNNEITREWETLFKDDDENVDFNALARHLDTYTVEFPPEHVIQSAVEHAVIHVSQSRTSGIVSSLRRFFSALLVQLEYVARWFWAFSAGLFAIGYAMTVCMSISPLKIILLLSPMPLVLGVMELLRSTDNGMAEMEYASKMSLTQIVMARFVLIGSYNIVLNSLISLGLYLTYGIDLLKVILLWFVPFTWISSIMLFLAARFRGSRLTPIAVCIWGILSTGLLSYPKAVTYLLSLDNWLYAALSLIGLILVWLQFRRLWGLMERGLFVEVTN